VHSHAAKIMSKTPVNDALAEVEKAVAKPTKNRKKNGRTGAGEQGLPQDAERLKESLDKMEAYIYAQPKPMWGNIFRDNEEGERTLSMSLSSMFQSLLDEEKRDKVADRIMSEIVLGAYQDRIVAYSISPSGHCADGTEAMEMIQKIRHRADRHLLRVLQAFKDIRRPPVKVVVKQAEQVNVAERQMNVDKQLNISSDLDEK
jgi:hypothetical protein